MGVFSAFAAPATAAVAEEPAPAAAANPKAAKAPGGRRSAPSPAPVQPEAQAPVAPPPVLPSTPTLEAGSVAQVPAAPLPVPTPAAIPAAGTPDGSSTSAPAPSPSPVVAPSAPESTPVMTTAPAAVPAEVPVTTTAEIPIPPVAPSVTIPAPTASVTAPVVAASAPSQASPEALNLSGASGIFQGVNLASVDAPNWLRDAGLAWTAEKVSLRTTGTRLGDRRDDPIPEGMVDPQAVETHVAMRRSDSGSILGVVGSFYCPCQNDFVWSVLQQAGFGSKGTVDRVHVIDGGALVSIDVRVLGLTCQTEKRDLSVVLRIANAHDGSRNFEASPMIVLPGKGMIPAFTASGGLARAWKVRHRAAIRNAVTDMSKVWAQTAEVVKASAPVLQQYTTRALDADTLKALLIASIDRAGLGTTEEQAKAAYTRIEEAAFSDIMKGTRVTLFEIVDRIASYTDHQIKVRRMGGKSSEEARASSAIQGAGFRLKTGVLNELAAYLKTPKP